MLVNVDASALEWICASYLSKDETAFKEITARVDQHTANQERFGLPSRLIAKTFVFRLIYGGSAYSYANDPDFYDVSSSEKFWQGVIDEFYTKYKGIGQWHTDLMSEATTTGMLRMPTGRIYNFSSTQRRNDLVWPRTKILNYPVQGLGADLMTIARVSAYRRFKQAKIEGVFISTIHDSIVADVATHEVERTCKLFLDVFKDIPANFQRVFGVEFNLPTRAEVSYGMNKFDLQDYKEGGIIEV
jgi:DNA polymerase I-like protein with 3'-5' exonuclease and polymerase domains